MISSKSVNPLRGYRNFSTFQDGILYFYISEILLAMESEGPSGIIVPNFIKIRHSVAELSRFSIFQDGGRPPSWICLGHMFWTARHRTGKPVLRRVSCLKAYVNNLRGVESNR